MITQRNLIFQIILIVIIVVVVSCNKKPEIVRFGVCADVHKDVMHDSDFRLKTFIDRMNAEKVDFIIQLGDFCRPYDYNRSFMDVWSGFEGPDFHVLGNHDMDGGFTRGQTVEYWNMQAKYYSFDLKGFHFIVLDGNDKREPPQKGYSRYIGSEQGTWLDNDLNTTHLPTLVFSHQSLANSDGVENADEVKKILEEANKKSKYMKVVACICGHHHKDYIVEISGIQYIHINSMSYYWLGGDYLNIRYSEEIDKEFPWIKYTAPYKDPVFAIIKVATDGTIKIEGVETKWVGPSPMELDYPMGSEIKYVRPGISDTIINSHH
ncbi:MAG: metallophosphoesterase [Bacteroidales bacterium]|nr:metallophosphoesterase [Bacteroidales bacterium]